MAVEARHLANLPPQLIANSDMMMNTNQGNLYAYNNQMGFGVPFTAQPMPETLLPFQQYLLCDSLQPKGSMKAESGVTYNMNTAAAAPRKRSRDPLDQLNTHSIPQKNGLSQFSSFIGQDVSLQIQQQELEIEQIIAHHTKKIRLELEERQKQEARLLVSAIGEGILKKLKEKDEQIQRTSKLTLALQERVKSLYVENQLWRDLAKTNEATANSLRSNLEQVLAHVSEERFSGGGCGGGRRAAVEEDLESCCGSRDHGRDTVAEVDGKKTLENEGHVKEDLCGGSVGGSGGLNRMCRMCGERESCVLLLPCRHLCLCTLCGSTLLQTCPVCNSNMNATVHVITGHEKSSPSPLKQSLASFAQ